MILEELKDHVVSVVAFAGLTTILAAMRNQIRANLHEPFLREMVFSFALIALAYVLVIGWRRAKG